MLVPADVAIQKSLLLGMPHTGSRQAGAESSGTGGPAADLPASAGAGGCSASRLRNFVSAPVVPSTATRCNARSLATLARTRFANVPVRTGENDEVVRSLNSKQIATSAFFF